MGVPVEPALLDGLAKEPDGLVPPAQVAKDGGPKVGGKTPGPELYHFTQPAHLGFGTIRVPDSGQGDAPVSVVGHDLRVLSHQLLE